MPEIDRHSRRPDLWQPWLRQKRKHNHRLQRLQRVVSRLGGLIGIGNLPYA